MVLWIWHMLKTGGDATEDEINLIVSVLKNNIPFDVVGENYVSH